MNGTPLHERPAGPVRNGRALRFRLVFGLEIVRATRRRRLFVLNACVPLLLVLPVATAGAPPHHAAAVYAVMFVLFGTFGAAIPVLRDAESGLLTRLRMLPIGPATLVIARSIAGACLDLVQLLPAVLVLLVAGKADASAFVALPAILALTLAVANLTGFWVAAIARSVAEGALFAAVSALLLLHASGVFRTPAPGSVGAGIEAAAPYRALHEVLLVSIAGGGNAAGTGALVVILAILLVATALLARRGVHALSRSDRDIAS